MTAKNKIIISLSSIIGVLIIALVSVVAVFAAAYSYTTSTVSITFSASDVYATITVNKQLGTATYFTQAGTVTITKDSSATQTLNVSGITFTTTNYYLLLEFIFQNDSTTESFSVACTPSISGTNSSNYTVKYLVSTSRAVSGSSISATSTTVTSTSITTTTVSASSTLYVYVYVELTNFANDSSLSLKLPWILTKS